ncbi:hypothetical protein [Rahnella sp. AA]|uniref:hypothetical protein n=1 Tax=Rahnella sp. AA TaxID=2057180 RepID=UPI001E58476D|nr:hypothetical protein [Rahnella sp. AA]
MTKPFSGTAQALMMSLLTGQVMHWQRAWYPQPFTSAVWRSVSTVLFSKILEPVWWCCRCPEPVVTVRKNTVYWLAHLVQEPGPAADKLWIDAVKARYQMQTNSALGPDADPFLLQIFQDYVALYDLYSRGRAKES